MQDEQFTFFWSHRSDASHSELSQFFKVDFHIESNRFNCSEQWMHWRKAILFEDIEIASKILIERDPFIQKRLGRGVKGFSDKIWSTVARDIVLRGNLAKFSQNATLKQKLCDTVGSTLVEASPSDKIWGIGLAANHPLAQSRETWQGSNWLGAVLNEVRCALCGA